jgi:hypothetical protein
MMVYPPAQYSVSRGYIHCHHQVCTGCWLIMVMHPLTLPSLFRGLVNHDSLFSTSWSLSSGLVDSDSVSLHTSKPVQRLMDRMKMIVTPTQPLLSRSCPVQLLFVSNSKDELEGQLTEAVMIFCGCSNIHIK